MTRQTFLRGMVFCAACFSASSFAAVAIAAPPASASAEPPAHLHGQVKDVDAKLAAARARNEALQAQVTQMEQQNAAQQKQLRQRDAQIAALQAKLHAAGVPASATSVDH
jgi:septal ring factor EnvC (AmiA/AmiB activator)